MPSKDEVMINNLKYEIQILSENPKYKDFQVVQAAITTGSNIDNIINQKKRMINQIIAKIQQQDQEQPEEEDQEYEEPVQQRQAPAPKRQPQAFIPPKRIVPKMRKEDYVEPDAARERELNEKIARAEREEFDATPEELGLNEDIPGLPEDIEDLGKQK